MKWLNVMRSVAISLVLMIHILSPDLYRNIDKNWWMGDFFDSLSRAAVPLFLMISGALLLHKDEPLPDFFKKRLNKIFIPFLFWSIAYYMYKIQGQFNWKELIKEGLGGNIYSHLWYFYLIIPLYVVIPFLRKVIQTIPTNYLFLYSVLSGTIAMFQGVLPLFNLNLTIFSNSFSSGVAYLFLGYALTHRNIEIKKSKWIGLTGLIVIFLGTYVATTFSGKLNEAFYDVMGLPVMAYAVSLFAAIKRYTERSKTLINNKLINLVSAHSFGIYLIHPILLNKINQILLPFRADQLCVEFVIYVFSFIVLLFGSLVVVLLINRIPFLNKII